MIVYLMRHGEAAPGHRNPERPLTAAGREETARVGRFLKDRGIRVDRILHSPKTRARETTATLAEILGIETEERSELSPDEDLGPMLDLIRARKEGPTLLVGHLPHLEDALVALGAVKGTKAWTFPTAGLAALEGDGKEGWKLLWSLDPRTLPEA